MGFNEARDKMQKAYEFLLEDLKSIRTGRASGSLVENILVTHYGQQMPIKAVANITTPDAKTITISPWDASAVGPIEKAIQEERELGLSPLNDGKAIHINVPAPTAERRDQLVKQVHEKAEAANVSLRNARHEAINAAKQQLKDKEISEDESKRLEKQLDEVIHDYQKKIDEATAQKKQEIQQI